MESLIDTHRLETPQLDTMGVNTRDADKPVHWRVFLVLMICIAAVIFLVSINLSQPVWEIVWIVDGRLSGAVLQALNEVRHELVVLALLGLNFMLYVLRSKRNSTDYNNASALIMLKPSTAAKSLRKVPEADMTTELLDQTVVMSDEERPGSQSEGQRGRIASSSPDTSNAERQLQISNDEVIRLREELFRCREQLEMSNESTAQFLSSISHELRTPMNGIMGMADVLLEGNLSAREIHFVTSIAASSRSLLAVINDLLDFSNIESGMLRLENGIFSLRDCVEDVCASLADSAHTKSIELVCFVDSNVPEQVEGDLCRVRQVIHNLVRNAIASTDEGEVVVRVKREREDQDKSLYRCDVEDSGGGISPEQQIQLFDVLSGKEQGQKLGVCDRGMGLAIAGRLAFMMNGNICFRSRLGEGARFRFMMELEDVPELVSGASRRASFHGARVLVVDDNETTLNILYHQLSSWGVLVETADSGRAALQALRVACDRDQGFDVLIIDLHMPGMDGIQLAEAVQAEPDFRHIRSIMLTSATLQLNGIELRRLGIYKYVSKPAKQAVLHDSLLALMPCEGRARSQEEDGAVLRPSIVNTRVLLLEDNPGNQDVALNALTPVVAVTANVMKGERQKCLQAGMDDYVSKPVRAQVLSHMIEKWTGQEATEASDSIMSPLPGRQTPAELSAEVVTPDAPSNTACDEASDPIINRKAISIIRGLQRQGKACLLTKVVGVYFDKTPELIAAMQLAIQNDDPDALAACAHSLKSSSAYLGADTLSMRCRHLELVIKENTGQDLAALIADIEDEYAHVSQELNSLIKAA